MQRVNLNSKVSKVTRVKKKREKKPTTKLYRPRLRRWVKGRSGKLRRHETTGNASAQSTDSQVSRLSLSLSGTHTHTQIPLHSSRLGRYATRRGKPTLRFLFTLPAVAAAADREGIDSWRENRRRQRDLSLMPPLTLTD